MHPDVKFRAAKWKEQVAQQCGLSNTKPPSTVILTILMATSICNRTSVYGFDQNSFPYHYYSVEDAMEW